MGKIGFLPDESQDQGNRQPIQFRGLDDARLQAGAGALGASSLAGRAMGALPGKLPGRTGATGLGGFAGLPCCLGAVLVMCRVP